MNTPEQILQVNEIDENKSEGQNYIRRIQGRDYGRILREYNTPAQWYKASPTTRSIYFYDPHYQKYLQQQSKFFTNIRVSRKKKSFFLFLFLFMHILVNSFTNSSN